MRIVLFDGMMKCMYSAVEHRDSLLKVHESLMCTVLLGVDHGDAASKLGRVLSIETVRPAASLIRAHLFGFAGFGTTPMTIENTSYWLESATESICRRNETVR
jgi:hypothetical protein